MTAKYSDFERRLPVQLEGDDVPLSAALTYLRTTNRLLSAFGWQRHPIVHSGLVRWSAPAPDNDGYVLYRTYAETCGDGADSVNLYVSDLDDCEDAPGEMISNDLELFSRLLEVHRTLGIGRIDIGLMIEAIRSMVLQYAGHDPDAISTATFAQIVEGSRRKSDGQAGVQK